MQPRRLNVLGSGTEATPPPLLPVLLLVLLVLLLLEPGKLGSVSAVPY